MVSHVKMGWGGFAQGSQRRGEGREERCEGHGPSRSRDVFRLWRCGCGAGCGGLRGGAPKEGRPFDRLRAGGVGGWRWCLGPSIRSGSGQRLACQLRAARGTGWPANSVHPELVEGSSFFEGWRCAAPSTLRVVPLPLQGRMAGGTPSLPASAGAGSNGPCTLAAAPTQSSSWRRRVRTSPSMSASRVRSSSIRRTAWITVEWSRPPNLRPISG